MFDTADTIAAIATPPGESGIGIIRLSGTKAYAVGDAIFRSHSQIPLAQRPDRSIQYGTIVDEQNRSIDEVLLLIMKGPHSYTAEDVLEIQCHGSRQSLEEILSLVLRSGARLAEPGEFTQRAFVNGRIDLAQAEAVMDIIQAKSNAGLSTAVEQLSGRLSRLVREMRGHLTDFITRLEVMIDYPEEDLEDIAVPDIAASLRDMEQRMQQLLADSRRGRLIRDGVVAAITGTPNAGKSSLLNQLLQEDRAIVTAIPGTTRDSIEAWITIQGIPVCLVDTAGIRHTADVIEQIGVNRARQYMDKADIVLVMVDASRPLQQADLDILEETRSKDAIILLNKSDLPPVIAAVDVQQYGHPILSLAAASGAGIRELEQKILDMTLHQGILEGQNAMLTNTRHIELMRQSQEALHQALETIEDGMPLDCAIVDIRRAWEFLGLITGDAASSDIVTEIFSRFCLGK